MIKRRLLSREWCSANSYFKYHWRQKSKPYDTSRSIYHTFSNCQKPFFNKNCCRERDTRVQRLFTGPQKDVQSWYVLSSDTSKNHWRLNLRQRALWRHNSTKGLQCIEQTCQKSLGQQWDVFIIDNWCSLLKTTRRSCERCPVLFGWRSTWT